MADLTVTLSDGTHIIVPAVLNSITTYILLEQEAWFEKEWAFTMRWLKPGMKVIDIGANAGVYSLPAARAVGSQGHVYAYEPGSEARALLERSLACNAFRNLTVVAEAVSDRPRSGHLAFGKTSELRSLNEQGNGEEVRITSLDEQDRVRNWGAIDFVKIDAEGEEQRILEGGRAFLTRHSPLVMFEVKAGGSIATDLSPTFRALGYDLYRLIPGGPLLVSAGAVDALDPYELNLFAAKPDRAAALAGEHWLIETIPDWRPGVAARAGALDLIRAQKFGTALAALCARPLDPSYRDALAAYAAWRSTDVPLPSRYAALCFGYHAMRRLCEGAPTAARLSTLARIASELGERKASVAALVQLVDIVRTGTDLAEPFWPAASRLDDISPGVNVGEWFLLASLEHLERMREYSSYYIKDAMSLDWVCQQTYASPEMERRRMLRALRVNTPVTMPERLLTPAEGHINAELWRKIALPVS